MLVGENPFACAQTSAQNNNKCRIITNMIVDLTMVLLIIV